MSYKEEKGCGDQICSHYSLIFVDSLIYTSAQEGGPFEGYFVLKHLQYTLTLCYKTVER